MHKSDKQLMREGNYTEALGDNYVVDSISASIWLDGVEAYQKSIDSNVIRTKRYSTKYALYEEELNDLLEEYPEAYYVISDCNNWM
tara:strand:- start:55 stop:312 length:258 start_codon:yes stop_codon:yes gene_type:complete